ncbi:hypothetical protein FJ444_05830 [Aestuariibacter sp. GS-14]|uniref:hypothetical protein n=1 Tax=Aestuariibacter sp. GS-14 TaxID=2590670 RepID=UPI001128856B|nr:hypothetical protein [Aestuariibacter sp. GS-14]TPV59687.1 hypothetical protein FJ444_05830 [Aestuariibacter sp. GS-14]
MRKFNESVTIFAAGITFLDFFYIPFKTENGPLSPFIVPILLGILFLIAFLTSTKDIRLSLNKIVMGYCLYSAGFVGFMAPIFTLFSWAFSDNVETGSGLSNFGYAVLIQVAAGFTFAFFGFVSYKQYVRLLART